MLSKKYIGGVMPNMPKEKTEGCFWASDASSCNKPCGIGNLWCEEHGAMIYEERVRRGMPRGQEREEDDPLDGESWRN